MRSQSRRRLLVRAALIPLTVLAVLAIYVALTPRAQMAMRGTPTVSANAERWTMAAPLPDARQENAVAELNGKIYVAGGMRSETSTADTLEVYDPPTDTWTTLTPMPASRHHTSAAAVSGKLYVIGGLLGGDFSPVNTVYEYDPATDRWASKSNMPTARGALAVAVLNGRIYVAGGSPDPREWDFAAYDPATDSWEVLPEMPTPRNHLAAAATNGRFYAIGGRSGAIGGITNIIEAYDPATRAWASRPVMPTPRGGQAAAVVDGCIYVVGGEGNRANPLGMFDQNEVFDPIAETWRSLEPMALALHGIGAASVGSRIYVPGGGQIEGLAVTPTHEVFDASGTCTLTSG